MTFFRKSLTHDIAGRAQRLAGAVTHDRQLELTGAARHYAGHTGVVASRAAAQAGRYAVQAGNTVRRNPRTAIAVGAGLSLAALATALVLRRRARLAHDGYDEHDPTRQRPTTASGDTLDGSGEDNPIPGETGVY